MLATSATAIRGVWGILMSTVVDFPAMKVPSAPRSDGGQAQVFIFTGVRYERLEYVPPQPVSRRKKAVRAVADVPFAG